MSESAAGSRRIVTVVSLLIIAALVWAYFTAVDEVARGDGRVIPAGRTQSIQATEPGVVKEIAVTVGQTVKKGDLIVRLDNTPSLSDLGQVEAKTRALLTKIARLAVEEQGLEADAFTCPPEVAKSAQSVCDTELNLLHLRRQTLDNTREVLEARLLQRQKEKDEAEASIAQLEGAVKLVEREVNILRPMAERKLVAQTDLIRAEREYNDAQGRLSVLRETVARLESSISEARLQLQDLELQFRQEALSEKTAALAELSILKESARGESSRVERTDIRTPVDGVINTMAVNTIGSFLQPGTVVAEVVPTSEELLVEARISPRDVAFVIPGQRTLIKISAFDFSIYGGLDGTVVTVSPDSIVDQKTGEPYFEVQIRTERAYLERQGKRYSITPGMICSVDIMTGRKTIMQYLLKPLNKAMQEAFSER